jgi:hypothetical protein
MALHLSRKLSSEVLLLSLRKKPQPNPTAL